MLTFETPFYEIENVVIFRDHAVPTLFHYLAGPPRLTRDAEGNPSLLLLKYRHALDAATTLSVREREQLGGAFLLLGVDCGIPEDTKQEITRELQARLPAGTGPISLVPVLYTAGTVKVLALDAEADAATESPSRFVRKVLGTATPSLMQDQRAIFSLALTSDAATLLEAAYEQDLSPIGVMYELEFSGLRPALAVRVRADLARIYESLKEELEAGLDVGYSSGTVGVGVGVGVDIGMTLSKLQQQGAIDVEILRQQEGASVDEMERNAMALLKETLLAELFQPVMSRQPTPSLSDAVDATKDLVAASERMSRGSSGSGSGSGGNVKLEVGYELAYKREEELKTVTYDYDATAPEKRRHTPNGFFSALVSNTEKARHILEIDLDDPFFKTMTVQAQTAAEFEAIDLRTALLHIHYGGTEDSPREAWTASFSPADHEPKSFQAFRDGAGFSYRYRAEYFFGGSADVAAPTQHHVTPWRESTSRVQVVHPAADVDVLSVWVEPGVVDFSLVSRIETTLTYAHAPSGFRDVRTLVVREGSERQRWVVRLPHGAPRTYAVQHRWHMTNGSRIDGQPYTSESRHLYVGDPFPHRIAVTIVPQVDPAEVQRVVVLLEYDDPEHALVVRKTVELPGPDFRTATVDIPVMDPERREYAYAVSLVPKAGGEAVHRPPVRTTRGLVAVLPAGVRFDVQVVVLGSLASAGILGLQIDLRADPPDGAVRETYSHLFEPGAASRFSHALVVREDRPATFEYKLTAILDSGETREGIWTRWDRGMLPIAAATVLDDL